MSWSRWVRDPAQARAALADPGDAIDMRAAAELDEEWTALGFAALVPGELVRPLELGLTGAEQTRALGVRLARELRAGDLVVLSGPLGAGKTVLTQGIGAGLEVQGAVTSPTFVLARVHRGPLPLVHVDAYRLRAAGGPVDLDDLALDDELAYGVTVVEWGDGLVEGISDARLHITLERGICTVAEDENRRIAHVRPHGRRWATVRLP